MMDEDVEKIVRDSNEFIVYAPGGLEGNKSYKFRCLVCQRSMRFGHKMVEHVESLDHRMRRDNASEDDLKMLKARKIDLIKLSMPSSILHRVVASGPVAGPSGVEARLLAADASRVGNERRHNPREPPNGGILRECLPTRKRPIEARRLSERNGRPDLRPGTPNSPQVGRPQGSETHPRLFLARTDNSSWTVRSADSTPRLDALPPRPSIAGSRDVSVRRDVSQPVQPAPWHPGLPQPLQPFSSRHPPIPDDSVDRDSMIRATLSFQHLVPPVPAPSVPEPLSEEYQDEARSKGLYNHAVEVVNVMGSLIGLCKMVDCNDTLVILKRWTGEMAGMHTEEKRDRAAFKFDMLRLLNDLKQAAVAWVADHQGRPDSVWSCGRALKACAKVDFFLQCAQEKSEEANTRKPALVEVIELESDDDTPSTSSRWHSFGTPEPFPLPESSCPSYRHPNSKDVITPEDYAKFAREHSAYFDMGAEEQRTKNDAAAFFLHVHNRLPDDRELQDFFHGATKAYQKLDGDDDSS